MSIVQPVNFQPITAEFKTPDVRLQTSNEGAEIAEGLSKTLSSFAKSYAGFKQDQAAANVLSAYESDAASVQEAIQNSDMSLVEKKLAVEGLAKRHPGVKHSDRAGINKLFGLDIYGDLYKEQESDKVAAQSELDKEKVTAFETQYPGLAASLTYDEKLSASNNLQIARSTVAGYLTYQNELDDLNKTVFRGSLDVIALQDLRNYLSTVNLSSLNIDQLADMEIQMTNALSSIVDIREADDIAKELIEPHLQIARRYSETSEIQTKALNAAFLNKTPALARRVLDNPPLLQYLPPSSRNAVDQILAKAAVADYPSLRQTFAYHGVSEQDPNGVAQTQSSFNAGWVLAHGASPDDTEVTRNITMDVNKNVREMQNVSLTGSKQPEPEKIVETVANMNKEDRVKEINNDKAMYINMAKINSAYHETQDPVLKEKLKNEAKETYKRSVSVALGNLMADIKEAEDKDVELRYDPVKGYARVYEVVGKAGEFSPGLFTFAKRFVTGKSPVLEEDLLKERTYNKGFLGFGGEAEKSYLRQVGNIRKNYDETIERIADTWHQDPILNDKEREEIWQDVIKNVSGGDSIAFSGGYLYDVGEAAEPVIESVSTATQAASEAPTQALLSAGEAVGEVAAAGVIGAEKAWNAVRDFFKSSNKNTVVIVDNNNNVVSSVELLSDELKEKVFKLSEDPTPENLGEMSLGLQTRLQQILKNTEEGDSVVVSPETAEMLGTIWNVLGLESNEEGFMTSPEGYVMIPREALETMYDLVDIDKQLIVEEGYKEKMYFDTEGIPTAGIGLNLEKWVTPKGLPTLKKYSPTFANDVEGLVGVVAEYSKARKGKDAAKLAEAKEALVKAFKDITFDEKEANTLTNALVLRAYKEAKGSKKIGEYWGKLTKDQKQLFTKINYNTGLGGFESFNRMHTAFKKDDQETALYEFLNSKRSYQVKGRAIKDAAQFLGWDEERLRKALNDYSKGILSEDGQKLGKILQQYALNYDKYKKEKEASRNPVEDLEMHLKK
jgi:hypothetical protein